MFISVSIHIIYCPVEALATESRRGKEQLARFQRVIWQMVVLANAFWDLICTRVFPKEAHEVLEGSHRVGVIAEDIPIYSAIKKQHDKNMISRDTVSTA